VAARARAAKAPRPAGPPQVANGPYFEFQVERPVSPAPGNMGPRYPEDMKEANIEGTVLAQFVVDTTGAAEMSSFKVLQATNDTFVRSVKAALAEMKFVPALVGDRKVKQLVQTPFQFSLTK
jgi:protein TonB